MCNEELTSNHVCREYLERLQPHAHFSTVPKGGGGQITLTQTSSDCQKNYSSLENSIYEEDENSMFNFSTNNQTPNIDVTAKPDYEHTGTVDDIHVSIVPRKTSPPPPEMDKPLVFPNSWLNTIYTSTPREFLSYDTTLIQQRGYYYPIIAKLDKSDSTGNSGGSGVDTEYYEPPAPPKFVRSVKRIKRDAYYVPTYETTHFEKKQNSIKREKKKLIYPTSYSSAEVTKNTSTSPEGEGRHSEAEQPRKKRKYIRRTTKEEQIENGTALWQFLMRKLEDSRCKEWIRWTGNDLEFKVLDQKEAAKQWGLCKNRTKMTFDKFSRSMRFYYSKGILVHNPDKRLTYIFCRQPHDPVYTEMLERVMKTLPPNTIHCTATCVDSDHDHEKIKLNVRRRPKKPHKHKIGNAAKNSKVGSSSSPTNAPCRSMGIQCDDEQYEEIPSSRPLIPDHLLSAAYNRIPNYSASPPRSADPGYMSGRSESPYHTEYQTPHPSHLYDTSPMAALIAAASQAIAVPVPEPRIYLKHEINSPPTHQYVRHMTPNHRHMTPHTDNVPAEQNHMTPMEIPQENMELEEDDEIPSAQAQLQPLAQEEAPLAPNNSVVTETQGLSDVGMQASNDVGLQASNDVDCEQEKEVVNDVQAEKDPGYKITDSGIGSDHEIPASDEPLKGDVAEDTNVPEQMMVGAVPKEHVTASLPDSGYITQSTGHISTPTATPTETRDEEDSPESENHENDEIIAGISETKISDETETGASKEDNLESTKTNIVVPTGENVLDKRRGVEKG